MKKYWIVFLAVFSVSCFFFNDVNAAIREYELTNHPTLHFNDRVADASIKLKGTKYTCSTLIDSKSINVSYIITINYPAPDCVVYLSLQDKEGFEIVSKRISPVAEEFVGTLKGNFSLEPSQYQKVSGAELCFMGYSK